MFTPMTAPPAGATTGMEAVIRRVLVPLSSAMAVRGVPVLLAQPRVTPWSTISNRAAVAVTAEPSTCAAPVRETRSVDSPVLSARATMRKVAVPLVRPAGMFTVSCRLAGRLVYQSLLVPWVAVSSARVTVTGTAAVRAEEETLSKAAVTLTM